ncbi:glycerophosphodiester phosphodiesterase family protein [Lactiplantibacillus sp. WILCCON 0030]|uniref:Glycerophosphodiester phosphodiesterase family protein n=1 Tax=Lactiplantibacillus brownii TaxID=3069269 RepID=A0ABU1AAY3_9LACO|nr:glycerophosphodiester phosphodiesterase family protein [Lactiplantibacillus brownii]MDQ7937800.1 glycerophosphodiester phosphodiesterase family protein [Lactiplantibacillus brownii]
MFARGSQNFKRGLAQLHGPLAIWWVSGLLLALIDKWLGVQLGGWWSLVGLVVLSAWLPSLAERSSTQTWSWRQRGFIWGGQWLLGVIWLPLGWGGYLATLQASIQLPADFQNTLFMTRYDWLPWVVPIWGLLWLGSFKWLIAWRDQLRAPTGWRDWWQQGWHQPWWPVVWRLLKLTRWLVAWLVVAIGLVAITGGFELVNQTAGRVSAILSLAGLQWLGWVILASWWTGWFGDSTIDRSARPHLGLMGLLLLSTLLSATWWLQTPSATLPAVIAHRGVNGADGVQNTTSALKRTVKATQPAFVEMDIQPTADQHWVVMHDPTLRHLADRPGPVQAYQLDQLAGLPLTEHGQHGELSSFNAYLAAAQRLHQPLLVEIKAVGDAVQLVSPFADRYATLLEHRGSSVHSLDYQVVTRLKQRTRRLRVGYITPFYLTAFSPNVADFYSLQALTVTREQLASAKREHKAVYLWTVDRPIQLQRLSALRPTGIITNQPGRLRRIQKQPQHYYFYQLINWLISL